VLKCRNLKKSDMFDRSTFSTEFTEEVHTWFRYWTSTQSQGNLDYPVFSETLLSSRFR
jgi:hypothetical protein